jgi:hypothetical protein
VTNELVNRELIVNHEFVNILLRTPYKIRAIGRSGRNNEAVNRNNFIILDGESVKEALVVSQPQRMRGAPKQEKGVGDGVGVFV